MGQEKGSVHRSIPGRRCGLRQQLTSCKTKLSDLGGRRGRVEPGHLVGAFMRWRNIYGVRDL